MAADLAPLNRVIGICRNDRSASVESVIGMVRIADRLGPDGDRRQPESAFGISRNTQPRTGSPFRRHHRWMRTGRIQGFSRTPYADMTRYSRARHGQLTLSRALSHSRLHEAWRRTVRGGLRHQELPDLHDHLDVHWRLPQTASRLHAEAIAFTYRPRDPEIARLEKSHGITRRTVIPSPADSIILQALVDAIRPQLLRAQPTRTSFYARSHQPRTVADIDSSYPSDWLMLWKEGQRRIWRFTQVHEVIVVTDIANYFDAIPLAQLRNRVAALGHFDQPMLDFMFFLLAQLVWRPEYLPPSGTGLPQIQFDAPRLLAHVYLYEADRYLNRACKGDVVRWMDDISFGVKDIPTAKTTLRELDELLSSLGLRLNTGKTKILSAREGVEYFRMEDNRNLSVIQEILDLRPTSAATRARVSAYLRRYWKDFWKTSRTGFWEKIAKRFLTLFAKVDDAYLQRWILEILASRPALRDSVFRYYQRLGYSRYRFKQITSFMGSPDCLDDASLFGATILLANWSTPSRGPSIDDIGRLARALPSIARTPAVGFAAGLWLLTKHGSETDIGTYAIQHERLWRASQWASRQVAAATIRMDLADRRNVARTMASFGLLEGEGVLTHLNEIRQMRALKPAVRRYILHPSRPFPLPKVLVGLLLLKGSLPIADKASLRTTLLGMVGDPTYAALVRKA